MPSLKSVEKVRECFSVDLEKTNYTEELWYSMRKSEVAGKYVRLVQDMHEGSEPVVTLGSRWDRIV